MIKGRQTLTKIFTSEIQRQGIQGNATQDRDICLCYRYYYYYEILQIRHDKTIENLEPEFFISQDTITKRLTACADLLKDLVYNKPTRSQLKRKYPHLVWN